MDLSLEQRLLRMLRREEDGEARSVKDMRALPSEERVLEGECIGGAVFRGVRGQDHFEFAAPENMSKFRAGDSVLVGDGVAFEDAISMQFGGYDGEAGVLTLWRDPWARGQRYEFVEGAKYCIDRKPLGVRGRLAQVVQDGFANPLIRAVLEGTHEIGYDEARRERAAKTLRAAGLNDVQVRAGAAAIATESLAMVQGPPGTGKTRMLAEVLRALCGAGCRIALSAFTHRAVDNVLLALRKLDGDLPLIKLGKEDRALRQANIRSGNPRRGGFPDTGCVIAGTCFALSRLGATEKFHFTVFDEAGQLPMPHAIAGMLLAKRWIFVGDHAQLPPVITSHHPDREVTLSVFEHLNRHYGSEMLNVTYRMNGPVCEVVGGAFYGGKLTSAVPDRRMPFVAGGEHDDILDPEKAVVLAQVDHLQPGMRSSEEAAVVADLVHELRTQHGIEGREIAVLAPFRAQVRLIRSALQKRGVPADETVVVDTVERMQGQEREVVLISLAVGDPDTLSRRAAFFFSTNRLNVAMSRARSKVVLVASEGAFRGLPMDPDSLRAASLFKSLYRSLPRITASR